MHINVYILDECMPMCGLPWWLSGRVCLPRQETQVQFLGWEDPLETEMATHSSILAWKIPWTEKPEGYSPWVLKDSDT